MSSAQAVAAVIRDYLTGRGGSAPAGDVVEHAVGEGFPGSTVRRVAAGIVTKTRAGNAFTWSLAPGVPAAATKPADTTPADDAPVADDDAHRPPVESEDVDRRALIAELADLGVDLNDYANPTDVELAAIVEHEHYARANPTPKTTGTRRPARHRHIGALS